MKKDLKTVFPSMKICAVDTLQSAVAQADVIVTATGAKEPVIRAEWVKPGQHITSVGSDDTTKCEIDPAILKHARVYVDAIEAAVRFGVVSRAIAAGLISETHLVEIGTLHRAVKTAEPKVTVACLSGLGIQDLTAINGFWGKLKFSS